GGQSSGKTMAIMVDTLKQVQQGTQAKTKKRWVKVVALVGASALVVVAILLTIVLIQKRQLDALVAEKHKIDNEIAKIEKQMEEETDPDKLDALQAKLDGLTGKAQLAIADISKKNKEKAKEVEQAGDELHQE